MGRPKGSGRPKDPPKPNLTCSECAEPTVRPRRPSETGMNYCQKPECQAAKQRFYQKRSRGNVRLKAEAERVRFVRYACSDRVHCTSCGLTTAVLDYPHRDQFGEYCLATGRSGSGVLDEKWLDAAMPPETRVYEL